MPWLTTSSRLLGVFAVTSFVAVALGAFVCSLSGVPASLWIRNLAAWTVGGMAAAALARWGGRCALYAALVAAPLGLAATMLDPGLEGVHRWLVAGPVRFNAAMLLLPAFVVATAALAGRARSWWAPALAALGLLVLQPDASQATALALAVCAIVAGLPTQPRPLRWGLPLAAPGLAAFSWTRRDPPKPVPEVEEIIQLANSHSPILAALGVLALIAFAAVPALARGGDDPAVARRAGLSLAVLLLAWIATPVFGAFPVPLVGVGLSPILGVWLGVGLLASLRPASGSARL